MHSRPHQSIESTYSLLHHTLRIIYRPCSTNDGSNRVRNLQSLLQIEATRVEVVTLLNIRNILAWSFRLGVCCMATLSLIHIHYARHRSGGEPLRPTPYARALFTPPFFLSYSLLKLGCNVGPGIVGVVLSPTPNGTCMLNNPDRQVDNTEMRTPGVFCRHAPTRSLSQWILSPVGSCVPARDTSR